MGKQVGLSGRSVPHGRQSAGSRKEMWLWGSPLGIVPGAFLLVGGGWVLVDHFVLDELRGQAVYLPQVIVELAMVAGVAVLMLLFQVRVARDRALLLASEERFRGITESITDYVYTVRKGDGGAIVTEPGPGCEAITGFTADELTADPYRWLSMVVPEDRNAVLEQARRALAGERTAPIEHRLVRKDGALRWVRSTVVPRAMADGELAVYDGLISDITERRALQEQLRQAQKMEAVGQLAGGVAHDFNNLLTAVRGYAELARAALGADDPARADVEEVIVAADRAAELTSQLLAFSRRQVLQPQVLDAAAATVRLAPMLRRLLGEHIELDTGGTCSHGRVKVDPGQLEQVVVNLAVNARDAMHEGGRLTIETADVELDTTYASTHPGVPPGPYVMLTVSDTGSGMDADTRARAFEPFFTTKEPGKGTGMGLATVYGIVRQSGGSIFLYSEPGIGTTFRIYFPRVDEPASRDAGSDLSSPTPSGGETVLLVEDDPAVRGFARRALAAHGYVVLEASSGAEALALADGSADKLDLLVTDLAMPGMNGRELAERLRASGYGVPVLYVSGFPENQLGDSELTQTRVAFLPKPYAADAIARAVRATLDGLP